MTCSHGSPTVEFNLLKSRGTRPAPLIQTPSATPVRRVRESNCTEGYMAESLGSMATLKNQGLLVPENSTHFRVERNFFIAIMAKRIAAIKFDEAWYLSKYPDVRDAVKRGIVASGREHYVSFGYYEH